MDSKLHSNNERLDNDSAQPQDTPQTPDAWRDEVVEQIIVIRDTGLTNMFDVKNVFEIAVEMDFNELADFIFTNKKGYGNFILSVDRKHVVKISV